MDWIGASEERAFLIASLAPIGRQNPGALARWRLTNFPDSGDVAAALRGRFYEGSSTGPMSAWIEGLAEDLEGWQEEAPVVRTWALEFACRRPGTSDQKRKQRVGKKKKRIGEPNALRHYSLPEASIRR